MKKTIETKNTNASIEDFDWDVLDNYTAKKKRVPNPKILEKYGDRIYNHQPYALDMYEAIFLNAGAIVNKEASLGEVRTIVGLTYVGETDLGVTLNGLIDCVIELKAEKNFVSNLGFETLEQFTNWLKTEDGTNYFLKQEYQLVVDQVKPYVKGSINKGQSIKMQNEFFEQITKPTNAYIGKIIEKNGGGFIINVQGIKGFLPGSLAATNIVRDFDSMIGKEIPVVVEDYLRESDTFVFSYKKYVSMILPSKIEDLDVDMNYTGTVTGVAKFGVFIEFDEIFTGLLHSSKMTPECRKKFHDGGFKAGDRVAFWIKEITADKKIILTDEDPSVRRAEIEDFKEKNLGQIKGGEVVSIQPFGTLVKLQKDIVGMISQKEIKTKKKNFSVGDTVMVSIDRVHNDKIFLSLPNEA
jgi:ribosomal protein S1